MTDTPSHRNDIEVLVDLRCLQGGPAFNRFFLPACAKLGVIYAGQLANLTSKEFLNIYTYDRKAETPRPAYECAINTLGLLGLSFRTVASKKLKLEHLMISKVGAGATTPWRKMALTDEENNSPLRQAWIETAVANGITPDQLEGVAGLKQRLGYDLPNNLIQDLALIHRLQNQLKFT